VAALIFAAVVPLGRLSRVLKGELSWSHLYAPPSILIMNVTTSMDPVDIILSQTPEALEEGRELAKERGMSLKDVPDFNPAKLRIPKAFLQRKLNQLGGYQQIVHLDINLETMNASALGNNDPKDRDNISVELVPIGNRYMYDKMVEDIYRNTWKRIHEEDPDFDEYFTPHHLKHPDKDTRLAHSLDETVFIPKNVSPENVTYIHCGPLTAVVYCKLYDEPDAKMWIETPILKEKLRDWKTLRASVRQLVQQFYLNP